MITSYMTNGRKTNEVLDTPTQFLPPRKIKVLSPRYIIQEKSFHWC